MSKRNISDPKLLFASLQAQFDIFVNQGKQWGSESNQFSAQQENLDHELDSLMDDVYHHPSLLTPHSPRLQEKEGDAPAEQYRSSRPHLAASAKETEPLSIDSGPSYFNAMAAVFSVASIMVVAVSWSLWPTSHWNWPYAPPKAQRVDIAKTVTSVEVMDITEHVASVEAADTAEPVASIEVSDTEAEKSTLLNTILAVNPTGAGNKALPVQQNQLVETVLKIVPPIGRIRSEPGLQGKVVARLEHGSLVVALGRQGDWLRVRLPDNREAWAYKTIVAPTINEADKGAQISGK